MKLNKFVAIAAFVALGSVSNFAAAQTILKSFNEGADLFSAFDGHQFGSGGETVSGSFDYTYDFNLAATTAFTTTVNGWWNITGMTGTIVGNSSGSHTLVANGTGSTLTFGALSGDTHYTLHFTGSSPVAAGQSFTVGLTSVAAVPEPETYAMLLAGLGVIGAVARRRSRISVA